MSDGAFHFTLTERFDRNHRPYLFAGIRILNSVLFIREMPQEEGEPRRFEAILKPYREKEPNQQDDNYGDIWDREANKSSDSVKQVGDKDNGKASSSSKGHSRK